MPKIGNWDNLPARVRQHLIDRMRDRAISVADLYQLRLWIESKPEVPEGEVALRRLHRNVAQQKLDLLQFASSRKNKST